MVEKPKNLLCLVADNVHQCRIYLGLHPQHAVNIADRCGSLCFTEIGKQFLLTADIKIKYGCWLLVVGFIS